jgi:hypothetical protein
MDLDAAAAAIVAALQTAGIRATVDERELNTPAVFVAPPALTYRFGKGYWDAAWTLSAVVTDNGRRASLAALGDLVAAVQDALGGRVTNGRPIDLIVPGGAAPLPAYELTFTERISP